MCRIRSDRSFDDAGGVRIAFSAPPWDGPDWRWFYHVPRRCRVTDIRTSAARIDTGRMIPVPSGRAGAFQERVAIPDVGCPGHAYVAMLSVSTSSPHHPEWAAPGSSRASDGRFRVKKTPSINGSAWRGAIACASVALLCAAAHLIALESERQRSLDNYLRHIARTGAGIIERGVDSPASFTQRDLFQQWIWAAMSDRIVVGAALLDAEGRVIEVQPADMIGPASLGEALAGQAERVDLGEVIGLATITFQRSPSGSGVVILSTPSNEAVLSHAWWVMFLVGGAATLLTWMWIRSSLRRSVIAPLEALIAGTTSHEAMRISQLPTDRGDGFGQLARRISSMVNEYMQSRARSGQLERTVDARVAEQTKRIQTLLDKAERRAWIDSLTGLGNRRLLDDRLESVFAEQRRHNEDMSIVVLDLDNFKGLNDTLGHSAGDELLAFVGELLRSSLRTSDIGLRYGGDEFVAILLGSDVEEAAETADRLIKLFGQRASLYPMTPRVTMSAGIASLQYHRPDSGSLLLELADAALYRAKRAGKAQAAIHPRGRIPTSIAKSRGAPL